MSENIEEIIKDPYFDMNISFMIPTVTYEGFENLYKNLIETASCYDGVEILIKADVADKRYTELLDSGPFQYKLLFYPPYHRRNSCHIFHNDLAKIASGKLFWVTYEDCRIIKGDWYKSLMSVIREKKYKDNIFNIAIPMDNGKGYKQICSANIISREWFEFFGTISPYPNSDRWLCELAKKIGRYSGFDDKQLVSHFPKGRRVLSKKQRKELFYPKLEKYVKKFKER